MKPLKVWNNLDKEWAADEMQEACWYFSSCHAAFLQGCCVLGRVPVFSFLNARTYTVGVHPAYLDLQGCGQSLLFGVWGEVSQRRFP